MSEQLAEVTSRQQLNQFVGPKKCRVPPSSAGMAGHNENWEPNVAAASRLLGRGMREKEAPTASKKSPIPNDVVTTSVMPLLQVCGTRGRSWQCGTCSPQHRVAHRRSNRCVTR